MQWPETVVCQHGLVSECPPSSLPVRFGRALVVLGSHLEGSCSLSDTRYVLVGTSHVNNTPFVADTMYRVRGWVSTVLPHTSEELRRRRLLRVAAASLAAVRRGCLLRPRPPRRPRRCVLTASPCQTIEATAPWFGRADVGMIDRWSARERQSSLRAGLGALHDRPTSASSRTRACGGLASSRTTLRCTWATSTTKRRCASNPEYKP